MLDLRDRAEDVEHLFGLRAERGALFARRDALGEHLRVHGRVLTHLELGEVEAEGLDLPDQLLQVTVGLAGRAGRDERVLHDAQVGQQVRGVAVGEVGVAATGGGDASREEQHRTLVGLALGPLGGVGCAVFVGRRQALQQGVEGRARHRRVGREGEGLGDAVRRVLEAEQNVLGGDTGRLLGD